VLGELTRFHAFPPDVNLLMNHLEAHEADGNIELLVSVGGSNDFTVDEIGFWYFLTPLGRDVWQSTCDT
jgi:hypothetical protein